MLPVPEPKDVPRDADELIAGTAALPCGVGFLAQLVEAEGVEGFRVGEEGGVFVDYEGGDFD